MKRPFLFLFVMALLCSASHFSLANDGYNLWLQYQKIESPTLLPEYQKQAGHIFIPGKNATSDVIEKELRTALEAMLEIAPQFTTTPKQETTLFIGTREQLPAFTLKAINIPWEKLGTEGFSIQSINQNSQKALIITGNSDVALLYGTFEFLKLLQTQQDISTVDLTSIPKTNIRVLNHWDNPDRTVERGYAGASIWDWHRLPGHVKPQYVDYARANASIGINGTVLTNVNANAQVLTPYFLKKVATLADTFRPYGIKVYLTARFSAPIDRKSVV